MLLIYKPLIYIEKILVNFFSKMTGSRMLCGFQALLKYLLTKLSTGNVSNRAQVTYSLGFWPLEAVKTHPLSHEEGVGVLTVMIPEGP